MAGSSSAARIAMTAITRSSSINVNPRRVVRIRNPTTTPDAAAQTLGNWPRGRTRTCEPHARCAEIAHWRLIPLAETNLDTQIRTDLLLERIEVGEGVILVTIVVGIDHARPKLADHAHGLADGQGVRHVYAHKRHVDASKGAHLRNIAGIARHIDAPPANREHIAVPATLRMIRKIPGGKRSNPNIEHIFGHAVG